MGAWPILIGRMKMKARLSDGTLCLVIRRGEHFTTVLTPLHEILDVSNKDIVEVLK